MRRMLSEEEVKKISNKIFIHNVKITCILDLPIAPIVYLFQFITTDNKPFTAKTLYSHVINKFFVGTQDINNTNFTSTNIFYITSTEGQQVDIPANAIVIKDTTGEITLAFDIDDGHLIVPDEYQGTVSITDTVI